MPHDPSPLRILLVEDHADSRISLIRLLELHGYRVAGAAGIEEAKALAANEAFDLMLCDLGLPDGDGCDLMRELAAMYRLRGIALSGYGMPDDVKAAERAGFATHLLKPVSVERLRAAIAYVTTPSADPSATGTEGSGGSSV